MAAGRADTGLKLIVQIPCLNEEATLPATVADIPGAIPGIARIEILVVDDGSRDDTVAVARACGVHHILRHKKNQGLARSYQSGLERAIQLGADIIVNTDGDNQYCGGDIPRLVQPIVERRADIVIGERGAAHSGPLKRALQRLGSWTVSSLSGAHVPDAVSGFRAVSRDAALRLMIVSRFSYTTEMIIQAGNKDMVIESVRVRTNPATRPSRLFRNLPQFVTRQGATILRMYAMYRPLRFFLVLGSFAILCGMLPVLRFLYYFLTGDGSGHLQSLLLGGVLLTMGFGLMITGLVSDLISQNRKLLESALERIRRMEAGDGPDRAQPLPPGDDAG